ncbi:MAG: glycosyltransferase family 4 protein [Acidobacteria bacterium]|nr:glycosyltransferase family 4 protein [Acidobacteriota bacterium]
MGEIFPSGTVVGRRDAVRLLILGPGHPFRGGIARTTTDLVLALRDRGHRVEFFTPYRQYPGWLYPGVGDRDPDACARVEGARSILAPLSPLAWAGLRRQSRDVGADAWVLPYWTWAWAPWWRFLLMGLPPDRPPAVAIVHNVADHDAGVLQRLAARLVLGRVEGLFTHAESLACQLRELYPWTPVGAFPLPVPRVERGDRAAARSALGIERRERLAMFVGLVRSYKGVEDLLRAWARLPAGSPWRLLVAGEPWGELGVELRSLHDRLGLGARVRLDLRWIPENELGALMAAADLLVAPYRHGSQSAVVPLAFAHGIPVLATSVGGLAEVVRDGINGRIVPPADPPALARAVEALDDTTLARLRDGCRSTQDALGWDVYALRLEGLLERVVEASGR